MVELVDTLDLGSSTSVWKFESSRSQIYIESKVKKKVNVKK